MNKGKFLGFVARLRNYSKSPLGFSLVLAMIVATLASPPPSFAADLLSLGDSLTGEFFFVEVVTLAGVLEVGTVENSPVVVTTVAGQLQFSLGQPIGDHVELLGFFENQSGSLVAIEEWMPIGESVALSLSGSSISLRVLRDISTNSAGTGFSSATTSNFLITGLNSGECCTSSGSSTICGCRTRNCCVEPCVCSSLL